VEPVKSGDLDHGLTFKLLERKRHNNRTVTFATWVVVEVFDYKVYSVFKLLKVFTDLHGYDFRLTRQRKTADVCRLQHLDFTYLFC
jgi:hypothetical protein